MSGRSRSPVALAAYSEIADQYVSVVENSAFRTGYEVPALLSLLPDVNDKQVLDAGCGSGWLSELLVSRGARVMGIDVTPKMVEIAKQKLGDRAHIVCADLSEPLTFLEDAMFDIVFSSLAFHYVQDWRQLFSELHRILAAGGEVVFSVYHPFNPQAFGKLGDYFSIERIPMVWSSAFDPPVEVPAFRRSLSEIFLSLTESGFTVRQMVEPCPTELLRTEDPAVYDRLRRCPLFLCVGAAKASI